MSAGSLSPRVLRNYWLDVALLPGFLAVFITGELQGRWHQGFAVALGAGLAVHLVWHWPALKRLPVTLLGHGGSRSPANAASTSRSWSSSSSRWPVASSPPRGSPPRQTTRGCSGTMCCPS